ncbi:MAG: hypothetical protein LBE24_03025 [Methylobacillus sp.]|jgi:hypothetical protein|nr:hypothetical protein [Methylobacillus sp.]
MPVKTITAADQRRAANIFNILASIAVVLMPLIIPMMLWIAASIFVHASVAHHPNQRVRDYLYPGGYRFYGLVGSLVVLLNFSPQMSAWFPGQIHMGMLRIPMFWVWLWVASILIIVPFAARDIMRANRELWKPMMVEVENDA